MIRITKGGIHILCDTQADLKIAMAALADVDEPALPAVHLPVEVNAVHHVNEATGEREVVGYSPAWRVGGPVPSQAVSSHLYPVPEADDITEGAPSDSDAPSGRMNVDMGFEVPQYIPVRAKQLEVLEAVLLFPEGVPCRGIGQLLGLTDKTVGQRMQSLKREGLVEMVPHHHLWRATTLARRAKLVRA